MSNNENIIFVFLLFIFFLCIFYATRCLCKCQRRSQYNTPSYIKEKYATARLEVAQSTARLITSQSTGLSGMPSNPAQVATQASSLLANKMRRQARITGRDGIDEEDDDYEREILDGID